MWAKNRRTNRSTSVWLRPVARLRNTDYWFCGRSELKPIAASDDGVQTRLTFAPRSELPVVFLRNADGSEVARELYGRRQRHASASSRAAVGLGGVDDSARALSIDPLMAQAAGSTAVRLPRMSSAPREGRLDERKREQGTFRRRVR